VGHDSVQGRATGTLVFGAGVFGSSFLCAVVRGEVKQLLAYSEEEEEIEEEEKDGDKKSTDDKKDD
jgi:hypothetical protein